MATESTYLPSLSDSQAPRDASFDAQSTQQKKPEQEKEKTKNKVVATAKTLHEGIKASEKEKKEKRDETKISSINIASSSRQLATDLEQGESLTDDDEDSEDEESPRRPQLRSNSCPAVPQLNFCQKDLAISSSYSSQSQNFSDTEEPQEGSSVSDKISTSARKTRSYSVSSSSQPPSTTRLRAECETQVLKNRDLRRQRGFTNEVEVLSSLFKYLKTHQPHSPFYNGSQELLEQMIAGIKAVNIKALEDIDTHLNKKNSYLNISTQINLDYKLFCKHVIDFYQDMQELYKVLTSEHIQIIAQNVAIPKETLCSQLATYLAEDKKNVEILSKLQGSFLKTMLSEKKTVLRSLINRHVANSYLLAKIYLQEIGEENIHLEKQGEKVWLKVSNQQGGFHKILAHDLLLKIPRCLAQEKLMFEALFTKIKSRIQLRQQAPSIAENMGVQVLTDWINLIIKGAVKLDSEDEKE